MSCNPCCCMKPKDGAVVCGIWSVIFALASIAVMSWQTGVLNNCRSVTMSQANLQCVQECPCVGATTARTTSIVEGLFIIQILCLISAFFLLFAGVALIYGVHTWSRYLIMPWFVCMIVSILSSLAYCIMWWAGDVRDYWLALTILEIIGVFINIFCTVVVSTFYTRVKAEWDYYEKKNNYRPGTRSHSSRRDLLERFDYPSSEPERFIARPFPNQQNQLPPYSPYPSAYPAYPPQPQYPRPSPPQPPPIRKAPYPEDPNTVYYAREPGSRVGGGAVPNIFKSDDESDLVSSWVKDQQRRSQHGSKADSEPPYLEDRRHPLKPSRSMPSLFEESASCHRDHRHRSSSRHRRDRYKSRDRDRDRDRNRDYKDKRHRSHRDGRDHSRRSYRRGRSRSVADSRGYGSESEETSTDYTKCRHGDRKRHRSKSRNYESDSETSGSPMKPVSDRKGHRSSDDQKKSSGQVNLPLSGGLTIPQHIVIPPQHHLERGPDGTIQPQTFNINSEIVIKYDKDESEVAFSERDRRTGRSNLSHLATEPRRIQPVSMQSNV